MVVKSQIVSELHRNARKNFPRRRVIMRGVNDLLQADLVEMIPYAKVNGGNKYLLTVIDTFSKYAWAIPLKSKKGIEVTKAFRVILRDLRTPPKNLQTDDGREFFNDVFKELMTKLKINHYSTYSKMKASIVERFNRTLKSKMWKQFSNQGSYKWVQILSKLLNEYNNTKHSTIHMKPKDVNDKNEKHLLSTVYSRIKMFRPGKFKVGDNVRISRCGNIFDKGYTPNWSTEIFRIRRVQMTNPITYLLGDYRDADILGGFYESELQLCKHPNAYLVEKIIRRKGSKVFVKWLGFDSSHNSWEEKKNIL